jgi:hypothetical protein
VPRLSSAIRSTETPDGYVLFDRDRGRFLCLNPVASTILGLALQGLQEHEIAHRIAADYVVDSETAQTDVHEFVQSLWRGGILDEAQSQTRPEQMDNL